MIKIGLVGLPNAGKSTLFNYLTKLDTLVAEYPFSTIDPSKSILSLSLEESILLANNVGIRTIKCSDMELWDIAGLVEDASKGQGLGNEFLGHIKSCDVLLNVVYAGSSTTKSDIDHDILTVRREIALFDHNNLLKHFERARRQKNMYPNRQDVASYSEIISRLY
jgi:ribosome-binding ATPase YchF (GTP1/OBG family)